MNKTVSKIKNFFTLDPAYDHRARRGIIVAPEMTNEERANVKMEDVVKPIPTAPRVDAASLMSGLVEDGLVETTREPRKEK